MKAPLRIVIVAALCIAALVGLVVRESNARADGTEVLLTMHAVDPRALLQGHYVTIALSERLAPNIPCPPTNASPGPDGWIALHVDEGGLAHVAGGSGLRADAAAHGSLLVRGEFSCSEIRDPEDNPVQFVNLDVGVRTFYAAQSEAEHIDNILREQRGGTEPRVFAIVSIGQDGRARLRGLIVDGERLELSWT